MNIIQNFVDPSKYSIKCPHEMTATRIVVHNTANNASAANEISYMINNDNQVSYHFAVDDEQVIQGIPLDRNSWNAGDGAEGTGNREGIAIEICYSKDDADLPKFMAAEMNAAELIAQLLSERGWTISQVTKHQDYSGKYCPHRTLDLGWDRFLAIVADKIEEGEIVMITQPTTTLTLNQGMVNGNQFQTRSSVMGSLMDTSYFAETGVSYPLLQVSEETLRDGFQWGKIAVKDRVVFIQMNLECMTITQSTVV